MTKENKFQKCIFQFIAVHITPFLSKSKSLVYHPPEFVISNSAVINVLNLIIIPQHTKPSVGKHGLPTKAKVESGV
jgi:hypothetical protein